MALVDFNEYSQDFTWDMTLHFPIPTLTYILNRIGEDLQDGRTEDEAKGFVLSIVREARNYAYRFGNITNMDRKKIEYHMAHNVNYIYEMLEYVMTFIQMVQSSGSLMEFYQVFNTRNFEIPALSSALGNISFLCKFTLPIHVVYEGF